MLKFLQTDRKTERLIGQKLYVPDLLIRGHKNSLAMAFNSTFRYIDDVLPTCINNNQFHTYITEVT
jgi:hypothetical protein